MIIAYFALPFDFCAGAPGCITISTSTSYSPSIFFIAACSLPGLARAIHASIILAWSAGVEADAGFASPAESVVAESFAAESFLADSFASSAASAYAAAARDTLASRASTRRREFDRDMAMLLPDLWVGLTKPRSAKGSARARDDATESCVGGDGFV